MPGGTVTFPKDFGRLVTDCRQHDARFLDEPGNFPGRRMKVRADALDRT